MSIFSEINWDEDKVDDGYINSFFEQDQKYQNAENLIEYLVDKAATQAMIDMLKLKTGNLTDGKPHSRRISYYRELPITKTELRSLCDNNMIVVVRLVPESEIKTIIEDTSIAKFYVRDDNYFVVRLDDFGKKIHHLVETTGFDVVDFCERDKKRTQSWIDRITQSFLSIKGKK